MKPYRLAIFASGSGSNAEAIMKFFEHHTSVEVALIISNKENAGVIAKAKQYGVKSILINKEEFYQSRTLLQTLQTYGVSHIVLAGFLLLVPEYLIKAFPNKIINIHPSLLPKFGGKGMYGMHVHRAVMAAKEHESGLTIHLVNEHFDDGEILLQAKCGIEVNDTAEILAQKVLQLEHEHYPRIIAEWVKRV
ncbi:MAG: phosphoribosylglycinamide formyltransferase [Cyclobacteriaceae bacterium]|jgi:phosphoribosylglycinamide formyltransferase-1|nr:phosphoribosylglycinamide formyltransferase [Cyclobacteriaceae bacterium]